MDQKGTVRRLSPVEELLSKLLKPVKVVVLEADDDAARALVHTLRTRFNCVADRASLDSLSGASVAFIAPGAQGATSLIRACLREDVRVVLLVGSNENSLLEASRIGAVAIVHKPVHVIDLRHLFQMFGLRVRENENAVCVQNRQRPEGVPVSA